MANINAKSFNNRGDLETHVIATYGRSVDKKDATIKGKMVDLKRLGISHGSQLWGVHVEATDYLPSKAKPVYRGKRYRSAINGVIT